MRVVAILLAVQYFSVQGDESSVAILAKDGTVLIAKVKFKEFEIKTEFGTQKVPIKDIKYIKSGKSDFEIKTAKSTLRGEISPSDFTIESSHGSLKISAKDIDKIVPAKGKITVNDENVVGFWDFAGDEDVTLNGSEYVEEDGVSAVKVNLAKLKSVDIPHKDELSLKDSFTIEMRFKYDGSGSGFFYFINKQDTSSYANFSVQFSPNEKTMYAWSHTTSGSYGQLQMNSVSFNEKTWHHLAITTDREKNKICVYGDGKKFEGTYSGKLDDIRTNKSPIKLFSHGSGGDTTFWLDFLRISNIAKTEEEIKESAEFGGFTTVSKKLVDQGYNASIVAKTGERYACKIENEKITVETGIGTVQVDAKTINKIGFFEYRESQINEIHKKAKDLIQNLGDSDAEKRDTAQDDLKKLGWIIIPILEENKDHQDEEVKTRVKKLLENFSNKKYEISKDRIEGHGLLLKGWIKDESIKAKTKYGDINIQSKDIKYLAISNQPAKTDFVLTALLKDGSMLAGSFLAETLNVSTEYGDLKIPLKSLTSITIGKEEDTIITSSSTIIGKIIDQEFELESQIGNIKLKKSDIEKIVKGQIKERKTGEEPKKSDKLKDIEKSIKELKKRIKEAPEGSDLQQKLMKKLVMLEIEYVKFSESHKMIDELKMDMETIRHLIPLKGNKEISDELKAMLEVLQQELADIERSTK